MKYDLAYFGKLVILDFYSITHAMHAVSDSVWIQTDVLIKYIKL